jgi:hypothetical protein
MSWFVVDVEADGRSPARHSMVCLGSVPVAKYQELSFYGTTRPISDIWIPESLAISKFTREQHLAFDDPADTMRRFVEWVEATTVDRPVFVSDNLAFDWKWTDFYLEYFVGRNPFGHSGRRIGDLYAGLMRKASASSNWKRMRKTKHTHDPVDDARGNAEALHAMVKMGLQMNF